MPDEPAHFLVVWDGARWLPWEAWMAQQYDRIFGRTMRQRLASGERE